MICLIFRTIIIFSMFFSGKCYADTYLKAEMYLEPLWNLEQKDQWVRVIAIENCIYTIDRHIKDIKETKNLSIVDNIQYESNQIKILLGYPLED